MSGFWRYSLLGFFGVAGVALALCLGLSSKPHPGSPNSDSAANGPPRTANGIMKPHLAAAIRVAEPVVEQVKPPIAQKEPTSDVQASSDSSATAPLTKRHWLTAASSQGETQLAQDDMMEQLRKELERAAKGQGGANNPAPPVPGGAPNPNSSQGGLPSAAGNSAGGAAKRLDPKSKPRIARIPGEGDNNLSIHIQGSDLRDVLELLSEQGNLNILPSPNVQGTVSASLNGVDIDTALDAILRSTGFVAHRDGRFIYVGTPADFKVMEQSLDKVATRVYRLNYTRASDIQALVTPLLTSGIGSISVTPAAEEGMADDSTKDGGNKFAGGDSILVHDYVAVLDQVDQVIAEIDKKPLQVAIEAMILRVTLDDKYNFGVDFALLRNHLLFATGNPLANLSNFDTSAGGLQFAYLDGSTGAFVQALETIGDTDVVASPKVMVVDKARAEILIGQQLGYVNTTITETSTAQNVQFLEVGAQLRLRPFISSDGLVRMEVHPELSTGEVKVEQGLTLPDKDVTQVTTNIMVRDGCTVIIGGLMRQDLSTTAQQVPFFGSLPGIGFLFRTKTETTKKQEIIVLLTPHIVCEPDACCEGDKAAAEFYRRQAVYADQMSPLSKRYLGRKYYRLAQTAWAKGDQETAMRMVDLAIHFDPESRQAIDLRTDIVNGRLVDEHTLMKPSMMGPMGPMVETGPGENGMPPFGAMPWEGPPAMQPGPYGLGPTPEQMQMQMGPPQPQREPLPPPAGGMNPPPPGVVPGPKPLLDQYRMSPPIEQRQSPPPGQLPPNDTQRQMPNQNQPMPAQRSSTASLKLSPLGSGKPLVAPVAKNQPMQQAPSQPPAIKSVVKSDKNVRQSAAVQAIDGEHMPGWMVNGLMQNGSAPPASAAPQPSVAAPARLAPTEARPIQPEGK